MLGGKVGRLVIIAALSTHRDGGVKVEFEIARGLDEFFKLIYVFELCITIQE